MTIGFLISIAMVATVCLMSVGGCDDPSMQNTGRVGIENMQRLDLLPLMKKDVQVHYEGSIIWALPILLFKRLHF